MSASTVADTPIDLAHRSCGGIAVTLYWSPADGAVSVAVEHLATERSFVLDVEPERALEAFYHPFGYAERPEAKRARVAA